ncbi:MAG: hypothetical protein NTV33_08500 [Coprothermobacterota bacterium]|nr:hypothetical protein [Coprothermobacterota bacterium]
MEAKGYEDALRFPGRYPGFIRHAPWMIAFCGSFSFQVGILPVSGSMSQNTLPGAVQ